MGWFQVRGGTSVSASPSAGTSGAVNRSKMLITGVTEADFTVGAFWARITEQTVNPKPVASATGRLMLMRCSNVLVRKSFRITAHI
jgi:hypothetical protein